MSGKKSVSQWGDLFDIADKDGNNNLDMRELTDLLKHGNSNVTGSQVAETFVFFDGPHGDKKISKEEFVKGMTEFVEFRAKLSEMFKHFDKDGSGYLDKAELKVLLESCGHKYKEEEIKEILQNVDTSGDGKVSADEFLNACT